LLGSAGEAATREEDGADNAGEERAREKAFTTRAPASKRVRDCQGEGDAGEREMRAERVRDW
jgi:hypothetical protein